MDIEWINKQYKEANRIFDSAWEAEEWADSLCPDFAGGLKENVGYMTPDKKVLDYLVQHLPKWANNNNAIIEVHTVEEWVDGHLVYKIWVTSSND